MKPEKLELLNEMMCEFISSDVVSDGKDGFFSEELHLHMAKAAENVYDSCIDIQDYMRDEGLEP